MIIDGPSFSQTEMGPPADRRQREMHRRTYNHVVRCLNCRYDLRNLGEHRCPECGREFDPTDPTTFSLPERMMMTGRAFVRLALFAYTCNLLFIGYVAIKELPGDWSNIITVPMGALILLPVTFIGCVMLFAMYWSIRYMLRKTD
jgi:hypothetical protein